MEKYSPGRSSYSRSATGPCPSQTYSLEHPAVCGKLRYQPALQVMDKEPAPCAPVLRTRRFRLSSSPCAGLFSIAPAHPSRSPAGRLAAGAATLLTGFLPPRTLSYLLAGSMAQLSLPGSTAGAFGFMHSPFKRAQFRPAAASVWPLPASSLHPDGWPDRQPCVRASGPFPHAGPGRSDRMGSW